ncbi:plastocyanin/azurin family copper-binding protein [Castellaniella sp.]|uniref:plastocyanin/azurin family copper-binding protein n=1 Tax=Castellaniella sp. TaxID=1955812 RepID=UPI003C784544
MMDFAHNPRRRLLLSAGGGLLLSAALVHRARAADEVEIAMSGTSNGSNVWFRPRGLLIHPGQSVRWINKDAGNVHTSTAYHPDNKKVLRIPSQARSWDSDYLMPGESFSITLDIPGVYDYFCLPHEHAGMVGRIIVMGENISAHPYADTDSQLPQAAIDRFPAVADILRLTQIE